MTEEELLKIQDELFANLDSQEQFKEQGAKEQYLNSIEEDISKELLKNYEGIPPEAYFNAVKEQYQEVKGVEEDEVTRGIDKLIDITEYAKEQKKSEQKPEHNIENNVAPEISNEQIAEENKEVGKGTEENLSKEDYINLLEKETAADLVLNINDSNEYREFKKNNPEEEIGIADCLNSLKNQTNNKAQKEGIENIEKQIKISFPESKGTKLTADAEKQKLDCALIRINDSKEYKEYKKEALERGEKVNEWSYLKKQLSSPHISPEEANKIEKTISLIEKHKPELVNILQNTEKKEQELSPIRKALLEQFKNDPNITANGEKIAQDILNSLFTPLKIAEKYNVPAVLDPVACGASAYRKRVVDDLLENYKISAIRGNAGEIGSLVGLDIASKGVDSANVDNIGELALLANKKYNIPIVVTGEVDAIAVAGEVITIHNGSPMMPKVIGTGCLLGAVVASFIGLDKDNVFKSLETSLLAYNIAGEFAEKRPNGHLPGTYKVEFINSLYEVTDGDISLHKKVKRYV